MDVSIRIGENEYFVPVDIMYRIINGANHNFRKLKKLEKETFPPGDQKALEQSQILYNDLVGKF